MNYLDFSFDIWLDPTTPGAHYTSLSLQSKGGCHYNKDDGERVFRFSISDTAKQVCQEIHDECDRLQLSWPEYNLKVTAHPLVPVLLDLLVEEGAIGEELAAKFREANTKYSVKEEIKT